MLTMTAAQKVNDLICKLCEQHASSEPAAADIGALADLIRAVSEPSSNSTAAIGFRTESPDDGADDE